MQCKCACYVNDELALKSMINLEEYYTVAGCYFNDAINGQMREMLSVWMLEICEAENVLNDVYYTAMNMFDRLIYCLTKSTTFKLDKSYIQLFGTCCMLLASKIRSNLQLDTQRLVQYTDNSISLEELLHCELFILEKLKWDTNCVAPNDYFEFLSHRFNLCQYPHVAEIRKHFYALTALCSTDFKYSLYPPSMIASSCLLSTLSRSKAVQIDLHNLLNRSFGHIEYECINLLKEQIEANFLSKSTDNQIQKVKFEDDYDFDCEFNLSDDSGYENSTFNLDSFLCVSPFNEEIKSSDQNSDFFSPQTSSLCH